ncbi:hypothetical protein J3B02_005622 [Coemansia erecta]|uniref:BHLH domain-containing protein n=1 Tax=Coemansia asiatica TaxID=1052880 RepID=A0A9W7XHL7_9FUNG|nr:hypothetical protein LPJ64_005499 [Coemansia asiatica]KAJ2842302.1 hypothetical protein J3B02_005622 [Coemansia erecta]KAJ2888516.1 hypothetical protein FB639_000589 [Coemansia asiatica]
MTNIADSVAAAGSQRYPPHHLYYQNQHQHQHQHAARPHYGAAYSHHPYLSPASAAVDDGSQRSPLQLHLPLAGAEERERKRRISHSAMERRRRERTNNIINELKALIPWLRDEARLQKLEVLEQCVCYIKELQTSSGKEQVLSARRLSSTSCSNGQASDGDCDSSVSSNASPSAHHRRQSIGDLPSLAVGSSSASSKASSTASTIGPFRGPLPKDVVEQPPSPGSKNSIGFLTT